MYPAVSAGVSAALDLLVVDLDLDLLQVPIHLHHENSSPGQRTFDLVKDYWGLNRT